MKALVKTILFVLVSIQFANAQQQKYSRKDLGKKTNEGTVGYAAVYKGDTIPMIYIKPVWIVEEHSKKNPIAEWKYQRLVKNVKKAYPYAKIAGQKVKEYNKLVVSTKSEVEKARLMKQCEKELVASFEKDIRNLTMTQGRILLKLIDRETSKTSYELLQQYRGNTSAFLWQSLATVFGNNLKAEYDPEKDDKNIENIVCLIERGYL